MNAGAAAYPKGWEGYRAVGALKSVAQFILR
jgi:hypothetical protein